MSRLPVLRISRSCPSGCRARFVRFGFFQRLSDKALVQRYRCLGCRRAFSEASLSRLFGQKKRHLNQVIFRLLVGGYSQRRCAVDLRINRKTVIRKFRFLGGAALEALALANLNSPKAEVLEFDDLETFEHSKLKPLSITLAVESQTRRILGFRVSQMPSKGKLTQASIKKYGPRADQRPKARNELFSDLKYLIQPGAKIKSDQNPHYPPDVRRHFPGHVHQTTKGRRGCVVGQGELKRGGFDPIFSLNHTAAMLRAHMNRLFRRTWCTTKLKERLILHVALYALSHNLERIHNLSR